MLNGSQCNQPAETRLYGLYLNDKSLDVNPANNWNIYPSLQSQGNDVCGDRRILGNSELRYRRLILSNIFEKLPKHTGLTIHFFLHQIDDHTNNTVTLEIEGKRMDMQPVEYGQDICGNLTRDAIRKITFESAGHTSDTLSFVVRVNSIAKIGLSNMLIFLKNCDRCHEQLVYTLDYLPVNDLQQNRHGLHLWMEFNNVVDNMTGLHEFLKATFQKDDTLKRLLANDHPLDYIVEEMRDRSYKLFVPLNESHLNAALSMLTDSSSLIVDDRSNADVRDYQKPLSTVEATAKMIRFDMVNSSADRRIMQGLRDFLEGLASTVLYVTMVLVLLGWSMLTEDLVQLLQVLFLFVYIESSRLPVSLAYPLSGLNPLQFLDYLTEGSRHQIWNWFLPKDFYQPSPHVFQQYTSDVNFLKNVAALILLSIAYLLLRVAGCLLFNNVKVLRDKSYNPYLRYLQNHHEKTFCFLDGVLRFVFFSFVWASLLQFTAFTSEFTPYSQLNATLCVVLFVGCLLHPTLSFLYLKAQYNYMTNDQYAYLYQDCFYQRLHVPRTPSENLNPFLYLMFRYYRSSLVALVVCLAGTFSVPLAAIIPLLVLFALEVAWLAVCKIYSDKVCLGFKLAENGILILLLLMLLVVYGTATSMPTASFVRLGYGCTAVIVLSVCNAAVRTIYLAYLRVKEFNKFKYDLNMQAIENNNVNETEKQLLRSRTKQMIAGPMLSKANLASMKRSIKSVAASPQSQVQPIGRQITSINHLIE